MALLLEVYNELVKEADKQEAYSQIQERVDALNKYAELATELLSAEYPNNFSQDEVYALADKLIERDITIAESQEKKAEISEMLSDYAESARALLTQEYGKEFTDETVEKLAGKLIELDAELEFEKEANFIGEFAFLDELNNLAGSNFESIDELKEALTKEGAAMPAILSKALGYAKQVGTWTKAKAMSGVDLVKKNPGVAVAGAAGFVGRGLVDRYAFGKMKRDGKIQVQE